MFEVSGGGDVPAGGGEGASMIWIKVGLGTKIFRSDCALRTGWKPVSQEMAQLVTRASSPCEVGGLLRAIDL